MGKNRAGFGRPLPAPRLTGGKVWVGGNEEEAETNPKVVFLGLGVVGLGVPRGEVRRRRRELVDEVPPTGSGRRGGVSELPEIDAKLMEGSG